MLGGRELCIGLTVTRLPSTCIPLARSSSAEIPVILWRYAPVTVESVPGEDNAARHQSHEGFVFTEIGSHIQVHHPRLFVN